MTEHRPPWPLPGNLYGMAIIESVWCTIPEERVVRRTLRERLFQLPWRPFQTTSHETMRLPDPNLYVMGSQIIGHPATIAVLKDRLENHITTPMAGETEL